MENPGDKGLELFAKLVMNEIHFEDCDEQELHGLNLKLDEVVLLKKYFSRKLFERVDPDEKFEKLMQRINAEK